MQNWLTDSELLVMKTIWENEDPLTVQEIMMQTNDMIKSGRYRPSPRF